MSDNRSSDGRPGDGRPGDGPPERKRPPEPSLLEELRDRLAEWIDTLVNPPIPVPVPVRRRR